MPAWEKRSALPALKEDEIQVWRISLSDSPCRIDWLSQAELQRFESFVDQSIAHRYCASRSMLRDLLSTFSGTAPAKVCLQISATGKPFLDQYAGVLNFNLSHSRDRALVAVTALGEVGVDLEFECDLPNRAKIAQRVMSPGDLKLLSEHGYEPALFTRLWTRFEARQKCFGQGVFGQRIEDKEVGMLSFSAGEQWTGALAWSRPDITPPIRFFTLAS